MDNKVKFNNALNSLVEYAAANNNHLTKKDVINTFSDIISDEKMYDTIYDYLEAKKISVEGYVGDKDGINEFSSAAEPDLSNINIADEASAFLAMYKNDLDGITPLSELEKELLIGKLLCGDYNAKERLIESHLNVVLNIASEYAGHEMPVSDLIQEGNIGLIYAVSSYDGSLNFDEHIGKTIRAHINLSLDEQINSDRIGEHIAESANRLDSISKSLSEKLEREPSVSELAERMGISEDEIERIIKFSLNALTVDGADDGESSYNS